MMLKIIILLILSAIYAIPAKDQLSCNAQSVHERARSAIWRAHLESCQQELLSISCLFLNKTAASNYFPTYLTNSCPFDNRTEFGTFVGCFKHNANLTLAEKELDDNSPYNCLLFCYKVGLAYAGINNGRRCICGSEEQLETAERIPVDVCTKFGCPDDIELACGGQVATIVYKTGIGELPTLQQNNYTYVLPSNLSSSDKPVKVLFLMIFNGRNARQIRRSLNLFYSPDHYFYIHVDAGQDYLYRELLKLEALAPNIRLKRQRLKATWGGVSFMHAVLDSVRELVETLPDWRWDFLTNICESSLPLLAVEEFAAFLTRYRDRNFIKFGDFWTDDYIRTYGLDLTYYECDGRVWLINSHPYPKFIRAYGGANWFTLQRKFLERVVFSKDPTTLGLKKFFNHTVIPLENFFHALLSNTEFCDKIGSNHLRLINQYLHCPQQFDHIDWPACVPRIFMPHEFPHLVREHAQKNLFFIARKFDAMVNQAGISVVEESLLKAYWTSQENETINSTILAPTNVDQRWLAFSSQKGYNYHWQNDFNWLDRPSSGRPHRDLANQRVSPIAKKMLLNSLARISFAKLKSEFCSSIEDPSIEICCKPTAEINIDVLQFTLLKSADELNLLVRYNVTCRKSVKATATPAIATVSAEAQFERIRHDRIVTDTNRRLKRVEVGLLFDRTQGLLRHWVGSIGMMDMPTLLHEWTPDRFGAVADFHWIDPNGMTRAMSSMIISPDHVILRNDFVENFPLSDLSEQERTKAARRMTPPRAILHMPGIWRVELRQEKRVQAFVDFLVLPDAPLVPTPINPKKQLKVWNYDPPAEDYDSEESSRTALWGDEEIDDAVSKFYRSSGPACAICDDERADCTSGLAQPLADCKFVAWSSISPDPKSEFNPKLKGPFVL